VYGSREPFTGVWRPDTNTGTVHYAEYAELPAKKIWSWGVDADGLDWRRTLSDNDSAYVEVQAGLFRNQETYAFLEPRQTIRFTEYWMPARGIGGIARANLAGVLNLSRRDGALAAAFNANRQIEAATVRILQGKRVVGEEKVALTPERTWTREVKDAGRDPYTFELVDAGGHVLLRQTEGVYDWAPAAEVHTGPQARYVAGDPLARGTELELQGDLLAALRTYQEGGQSVAAGRLCASLQRYADAIGYLEPAAAGAPSDPEIAYYLGLAYDGAGDVAKARTEYEAAARMPSWRAAASLKLGELLAREGDREGALERLRAAKSDPRVDEETIALEHDAEDPSLVHVDYGVPAIQPAKDANPERLLDLAAEDVRLGLYRAAVDLLSRHFPALPADQGEPGAVSPQQHPLVAYYRGYSRAKLGESPAADYGIARKLSTLYIFPSRAEDLQVLREVVRTNPADVTARYLLGTQLFARGLTDEALMEWNAARAAKAPIPVLHADIGRALLREKHDPAGALEAFREGMKIDPRNAKLYEGADESLSLLERPARELARSLAEYPDLAHMPTELVYALALERAEAQDFDGSLALFRDRFFAREEGGTNVRQVWIEVQTMQALWDAAGGHCDAALASVDGLAREAPGLPFTKDGMQPFVDAARTQYLIGQVESRCGRAPQAMDRWRRVAGARSAADLVWAWGAAQKLDGYDEQGWRLRLEAALGGPAAAHFREVLLLPDRMMSHHLARMALAELKLRPGSRPLPLR
jgi:tetratricopeptide (TPR) repeat protein